jgi:hypothetical protein
VPGTRVEFADDAEADIRNYRVSCDRIAEQLPSWQPRWTVADGAREVYQAIRNSGLSSQEFEGPRYSRIAYIRQLIAEGQIDAELRWREPAEADLCQPALEAF